MRLQSTNPALKPEVLRGGDWWSQTKTETATVSGVINKTGIFGFIFAIAGAGLAGKVAMVTDGQFSGLANVGIVVGEVSPEAATGGTIGLLQDGDEVSIDLTAGSLDVLVDAETLSSRPAFVPVDHVDVSGYLDLYRSNVQSLACGAVLCGREGQERCASRQTSKEGAA